jgi:hypothetical protein
VVLQPSWAHQRMAVARITALVSGLRWQETGAGQNKQQRHDGRTPGNP